MSNEIDRTLSWGEPGYVPWFPSFLSRVQRLFAESGIGNDEEILQAVLQGGANYDGRLKHRQYRVTSDRYQWMYTAVFKLRDELIILLFPYSNDDGRIDGTSTDRSVALFATSGATEMDVNFILRQVCQLFEVADESIAAERGEAS